MWRLGSAALPAKNVDNSDHALGSAAFLRSVGAQALRGGLAKNKNNKMIIRNHTTKISGSLTGLPDFLPSTENNWENVWWL